MDSGSLTNNISRRALSRLCHYKRLLLKEKQLGKEYIFSHELASKGYFTSSQVRRDLMHIHHAGTPNKGYEINQLLTDISNTLGQMNLPSIALFGLGHLGKAVVKHYLMNQEDKFNLVAAFDIDKSNLSIEGVVDSKHEFLFALLDQLEATINTRHIEIAILAVPPQGVQQLAEKLYRLGIKVFINFTGVKVKLPNDAAIESIDITLSIEKAAYHALHSKDSNYNQRN